MGCFTSCDPLMGELRPPKVNELPFSIQAKPVDEGILYELWIRNVCGIAMPYIQMLGEKFSSLTPRAMRIHTCGDETPKK